MTTICVIEGDGIGHEVVPAGVRLLEAVMPGAVFTRAEAGWDTFQAAGTALPEETVAAVQGADATLFGAVSSPLSPVEGYKSPIVGLRRRLGLYANVRPVRSMPVSSSRPGIDMLIMRENSEGLYSGLEHSDGDRAVTQRVITRQASERIVRAACERAMQRRRRLTIVHKANVLRATCGLFREAAFATAYEFPDVETDEMLVDACAMRLVSEPERFDVIVTTNLFGDILSDEASALVGGLGLAPSANVGANCAIFEPVHGSAPDISGRRVANPMATFLAVAMLLEYLGNAPAATRVRAAVTQALEEGPTTPDLGGSGTTEDVTAAVIERLSGRGEE